MQQDIDIWEKKDKRSAKQTGWNCSTDLVAAFTTAGFYKTKEEAMNDLHFLKNMIVDDIYPDINIKKDFETSVKHETKTYDGDTGQTYIRPTQKQIDYAKTLGIENPVQYSLPELSKKIDKALKEKREEIE
jgi:hypothetical protein